MNMKIKNVCAVATAMLPLLPLLMSNYTLAGLIVWTACLIILIVAMLLPQSMSEVSILHRSGWMMFSVIVAYCGILFAANGKFSVPSYMMYSLKPALVAVVIAVILLLIGRKRKHIFTAKLFEYLSVILISYGVSLYFRGDVRFSDFLFPLTVTIIFFFTDYIDITSTGGVLPGNSVGLSYHVFLAIVINISYIVVRIMLGTRRVIYLMSFSKIPDLILICAIAGAAVMILVSAVFREKSTINNGESSFYLSVAALLFIVLAIKSEDVLCLVLAVVYSIVCFQFVFYNSQGSIASAINNKIKIPAFFQNLIFIAASIVSMLFFKNEYKLTAFVFTVCIITIVLMCALFIEDVQKVIAFGITTNIYMLCAAILIDIEELAKETLIILIFCLIVQEVLMIPICMKAKAFSNLSGIYSENEVPESLQSHRKKNKISICIVYSMFWLLSLWICGHMLISV